MLSQDEAHVRFVSYKIPVEFIQENIGLFVESNDLLELKRRIMRYLQIKIRRASPLYFELKAHSEPKLELDDLRDKYSHMGKKTILDDYYISRDRKMLMMLIKPVWDTNDLAKTHDFIEALRQRLTNNSELARQGTNLVEDYQLTGHEGTIAYGFYRDVQDLFGRLVCHR